jgi:hypothetical protein
MYMAYKGQGSAFNVWPMYCVCACFFLGLQHAPFPVFLNMNGLKNFSRRPRFPTQFGLL